MWMCMCGCVCVVRMYVGVDVYMCGLCNVRVFWQYVYFYLLCFCIVSFMYIYSYLFCLYWCKDYCHRVTTELQ